MPELVSRWFYVLRSYFRYLFQKPDPGAVWLAQQSMASVDNPVSEEIRTWSRAVMAARIARSLKRQNVASATSLSRYVIIGIETGVVSRDEIVRLNAHTKLKKLLDVDFPEGATN